MWSRKYDFCVECGRDDRKHFGKGLCSYCYSKKYQQDPKNKARVDRQKHDWYEKQGGKDYARQQREERWFDGKREQAVAKAGDRCERCGATEQLVVHHRDGNGRGSHAPNNADENFETLCRACHARHHSTLTRWARNYDFCVGCGTTDRKHNAKGLCWKCYLEKYPHEKVAAVVERSSR